jgi:hypothetical protein
MLKCVIKYNNTCFEKKEEKDKGEEEAFTELEKTKKICLEIEEVERKIARTAKRRRTKHTANCQKKREKK